MKYDVFISYSRKDMAVADEVAKAFDAAGISYFIDRQEMGGGLDSSKVLATAIKESTVFFFLASKNSYESKYTRNEVVYAFNKKENPQIIPYIIDGSTLPDELELTLSSFKCRNMRQHPIQTVVEDVLEKIGRESNSPIDLSIDTKPVAATQPNSRRRKLWPWVAAVCAVLGVIGIVQTVLLQNREVPVDQTMGYVDLGLSVYWKNSNEWNSDDDHGFYTYDDAKSKFGNSLPTKKQLEELVDKCSWTWSDSEKGYYVKGPNGNSIFLPAAGDRDCSGNVGSVGTYGRYWSSTPNGSGIAWSLYFNASGVGMNGYYRCYGHSVRLVQGK